MQEWMNCLSIGVLFADRKSGKIADANSAALEIGDFLGKSIREAFPVKWRRVIQRGQEKRETILSLKDKSFHCFLSYAESGMVVELLDITKQREAEEHACRDQLTGAYNRWFLDATEEQLEHVRKRSKEPIAIGLIVADLDDLREINKRYGHSGGDDYLKRMATALMSVVRPDAVVARVGGDEFKIILPHVDSAILQRIEDRIRAAKIKNDVSFSFGSTVMISGESWASAWQIADAKLFLAKSKKKQVL
jgi:diguanylate cyclase (GGDEF)-like protein